MDNGQKGRHAERNQAARVLILCHLFSLYLLMHERLILAVGLLYIQRAAGTQSKDWAIARLTWLTANQVLHKHLPSTQLPDELTTAIHAASEDLRASALPSRDWTAIAAQAQRVIPVAQRVLRTLAEVEACTATTLSPG